MRADQADQEEDRAPRGSTEGVDGLAVDFTTVVLSPPCE